MNLIEAETKVREALQLLREVQSARHDLVEHLPNNGRRYNLFARFVIHDAVFQTQRAVDLLSDQPPQHQKAG